MSACDVLIGTPAKGVVTIGDAVCGSLQGKIAKQKLINNITSDVYQITGDETPVELNVYMVGEDSIFVASQKNRLFAYMTPPEIFYASVENGKFTGESGMTGMSDALDTFISNYSVNIIHPDEATLMGLEMYLSQMSGIAVNVVIV